MFKEIESVSKEIEFLKEIIFSGGCHVFFDIDGTLKGLYTTDAPAGFDPKLPGLLEKLNKIAGISVGACTSQSAKELYAYLLKMDSVIDGKLMNGISILEDGHILVPAGSHLLTEAQELISPFAKLQILELKTTLEGYWKSSSEPILSVDGWGFFPSVETPVAIPTGKYQGAVTLSIWEKGVDVHDPSYNGEYEPVFNFVDKTIAKLGASLIQPSEAGNGTLRILEKGRSKETGLVKLAKEGLIDLKKTIYVGDGLNDVAPATLVAKAGGGVIAVANAIPDLKKVATHTCGKSASHGVVEILTKVLG